MKTGRPGFMPVGRQTTVQIISPCIIQVTCSSCRSLYPSSCCMSLHKSDLQLGINMPCALHIHLALQPQRPSTTMTHLPTLLLLLLLTLITLSSGRRACSNQCRIGAYSAARARCPRRPFCRLRRCELERKNPGGRPRRGWICESRVSPTPSTSPSPSTSSVPECVVGASGIQRGVVSLCACSNRPGFSGFQFAITSVGSPRQCLIDCMNRNPTWTEACLNDGYAGFAAIGRDIKRGCCQDTCGGTYRDALDICSAIPTFTNPPLFAGPGCGLSSFRQEFGPGVACNCPNIEGFAAFGIASVVAEGIDYECIEGCYLREAGVISDTFCNPTSDVTIRGATNDAIKQKCCPECGGRIENVGFDVCAKF